MSVCMLPVITAVIQLIAGVFFKSLPSGAYYVYFQYLLTTLISVGLPCFIYLKINKKAFFTDCFTDVKPDSVLTASFALGFFSQFAGLLANLPVNIVIYNLKGENFTNDIPEIKSIFQLLTSAAVLCAAPAVFEEIMFRGIIFNYFRKFGTHAAVFISALLFALSHYSIENFFGPFVLGIAFGLITSYTNRICYAMAAHFTVNFTASIMSYLSNFSAFDEIYGTVLLPLITVSVIILVHLVRWIGENAKRYDYHDRNEIESVAENVYCLSDESTLKIIEHRQSESKFASALSLVFKEPGFYTMLALFIILNILSLM